MDEAFGELRELKDLVTEGTIDDNEIIRRINLITDILEELE